MPRFALVDLEIGRRHRSRPLRRAGRAPAASSRCRTRSCRTPCQVASTACTQPCDTDPARARQGPEQRRLPGADRRRSRSPSSPTTSLTCRGCASTCARRARARRRDRRRRARPLARSSSTTCRRRRARCSRARADALRGECWAAARCPRLPDRALPAPLLRAPAARLRARARRRDVDAASAARQRRRGSTTRRRPTIAEVAAPRGLLPRPVTMAADAPCTPPPRWA